MLSMRNGRCLKSDDPVTLAALRLTPDRVKFWRQLLWLLLIFCGLGGIFGVVAGLQYLSCQERKANVTFIDCVRNHHE